MADRRPRGGGACPGQHDCAGGGGAGRVGRAALRTGHGAACSRARRRAWEACPGCQPACLGRGPGAARWRHPRTLPVPACAAARSAANCGQTRRTRGSRAALCEPAAAVQPLHGGSGWGAVMWSGDSGWAQGAESQLVSNRALGHGTIAPITAPGGTAAVAARSLCEAQGRSSTLRHAPAVR